MQAIGCYVLDSDVVALTEHCEHLLNFKLCVEVLPIKVKVYSDLY